MHEAERAIARIAGRHEGDAKATTQSLGASA
jgi:hypothetical protein